MSGDRWGDTARDRAEFDRWLTTEPEHDFDDGEGPENALDDELECPCAECPEDEAETCRDLEGWPRV